MSDWEMDFDVEVGEIVTKPLDTGKTIQVTNNFLSKISCKVEPNDPVQDYDGQFFIKAKHEDSLWIDGIEGAIYLQNLGTVDLYVSVYIS